MLFLRIFQHLLPRARAWSLTASKYLRTFFQSLTVLGSDYKNFSDQAIYDDYYSQKTTLIDKWLVEYGLTVSSSLSLQEKRNRVSSARKERGSISPDHIQNILQEAGFDVYVFDWWFPGYTILCGEPEAACGEPIAQCGQMGQETLFRFPRVKNPLDYLRRTYLPKGGTFVGCGVVLSECGELTALCGNATEKVAYPLVNKIPISLPHYIRLCGDPGVECGEVRAVCGDFDYIIETEQDYVISDDPLTWRYYAYVGAKDFPELATVPLTRKNEFEALCLKMFPTHLWLGILVKYV